MHGAVRMAGLDLREAAYRVLRLPAVADKTFLISIGDRSVGRNDCARPDGGAMAGSRSGRGGDADGLPRLIWVKRLRWASVRRWR